MANRLQELLEEIQELQDEVVEELKNRQEELAFEIRHRSVHFREEVIEKHRQQAIRLKDYLKHAQHPATTHSRYPYFADFGDAEDYRTRQQEIRKNFEDLKRDRRE